MGKYVLFADDDALIGKLVQDLLEKEGYQVTVARNGKACLDMARARPPDLILLDIMMPGLDGLDVCRELRREARLCMIPVVMLTAMADVKLNERAFEAGAEVCMTKPFRPETLLNMVQLALENAARKRAPAPKIKAQSKG